AQHLQAGFSRKGIAGGHHAMPRQHLGAALIEPALGARPSNRLDVGAGDWFVGGGNAKRGWRLRDAGCSPRCSRKCGDGEAVSETCGTHAVLQLRPNPTGHQAVCEVLSTKLTFRPWPMVLSPGSLNSLRKTRPPPIQWAVALGSVRCRPSHT